MKLVLASDVIIRVHDTPHGSAIALTGWGAFWLLMVIFAVMK